MISAWYIIYTILLVMACTLIGYFQGRKDIENEWSERLKKEIAENKRVYNEFVKRYLS